MRIAVASDHAGFRYKQSISALLAREGHEVVDFGADSEEPSDYPLFIRPAAEAVARGECDRAIVLGGSGNGEAITANRIPGVRCALCWSVESAELARRHNDANVISIGQRMVSEDVALAIVRTWLEAPFDGGRHARRIGQIDGVQIGGVPIEGAEAAATPHEHGEECDALYLEWRRYHAAVIDPAGRFTRQQQLLARHERERFERQLRAIGCSGEARRETERDAEIAEHGHPTLA